MLLSGGVDSTVCAALMNRALGVDRVLAIHIDNGFMRKNESDQVRDSLAQLGLDVKGEDQILKTLTKTLLRRVEGKIENFYVNLTL